MIINMKINQIIFRNKNFKIVNLCNGLIKNGKRKCNNPRSINNLTCHLHHHQEPNIEKIYIQRDELTEIDFYGEKYFEDILK